MLKWVCFLYPEMPIRRPFNANLLYTRALVIHFAAALLPEIFKQDRALPSLCLYLTLTHSLGLTVLKCVLMTHSWQVLIRAGFKPLHYKI